MGSALGARASRPLLAAAADEAAIGTSPAGTKLKSGWDARAPRLLPWTVCFKRRGFRS